MAAWGQSGLTRGVGVVPRRISYPTTGGRLDSFVMKPHRVLVTAVVMIMLACATPALASADTTKQATASMKINGTQVSSTAWGRHLVGEFLDILKTDNPVPALTSFLNPVFQIQRTNGVRQDKTSYLAKPSHIDGYELSQVRVTRSGTTIVVTYWIAVQGSVINGVKYTADPNPSMATFQFADGEWTMLSYANFNKPS